LSGKRLGLLKEAVPTLSRVALLVDPIDPSTERSTKAHQAAAQALGLSLWPVEIRTSGEVEPAFAKIVQDRADGVALGIGSVLFNLRSQLVRRLCRTGFRQ